MYRCPECNSVIVYNQKATTIEKRIVLKDGDYDVLADTYCSNQENFLVYECHGCGKKFPLESTENFDVKYADLWKEENLLDANLIGNKEGSGCLTER